VRSGYAPTVASRSVPVTAARADGGPIDRSSPVPLYFQIAENLRAAVADGRLRPGDRLDNELDLCARLGVSRPTVRQAIQTLVQDGMVVRRRGLGTVVAARPIQRPLALTSLYDDLVTAGRRPATRVLEVAWRDADEHTAAALAVEVGAPVVSIQRLRSAGGRPLALMHNDLAADWVEGLDVESALEERGLYGLLRRRGAVFHAAEQAIGARRPDAREARLLGVPRTATLLTMDRVAYDPDGRPIEQGSHAYLADRYAFRVTLGPH